MPPTGEETYEESGYGMTAWTVIPVPLIFDEAPRSSPLLLSGTRLPDSHLLLLGSSHIDDPKRTLFPTAVPRSSELSIPGTRLPIYSLTIHSVLEVHRDAKETVLKSFTPQATLSSIE